MYLDTLSPLQVEIGYGDLGRNGSLGYEGKTVTVQRQSYARALSTHPPARLLFQLGGRFSGFRCGAALNDDVPAGASHADFRVLADGRQVALAAHIRAGEAPRMLSADVSGAQYLELLVSTSRWEHCHAVWLDPQVHEDAVAPNPATLLDCLGRAEITLPTPLPSADRCIATVVSPGFEQRLDDLLGSIYANGNCQDALVLVFALNANAACEQVAAKYRATVLPCRPASRINAMSKAILYSVAHVADARQFLCLDADMLVLGELLSVFHALDACPNGSVLACREGNGQGFHNLRHAAGLAYASDDADMQLLGVMPEEAVYPLVVNDGLFAGSRTALLALDAVIRAIPQAAPWMDSRRDIWWRNQFVFNLALARLRCGVELDPAYNVQLHTQDVQMQRVGARIQAAWQGRQVRVLHFSGAGKRKLRDWQGHFARVPDPLVGRGNGDGYDRFLGALRAWVGRHGLNGLAWSFYGTTDARTAHVRDPATLPLLALLHYLVRANGCVRALETGTARGVSAACLASAVSHRAGGRVVTLDPFPKAERHELWAALPEAMSKCIEQRLTGSVEGMTAAATAGETYDLALLDSIHTAEHVWAEFELARHLVCPGGLILIHDPLYAHGTVEGALRRIEDSGYGVVRLWAAEGGVSEDDHLGLAVIENRRRFRQGEPV